MAAAVASSSWFFAAFADGVEAVVRTDASEGDGDAAFGAPPTTVRRRRQVAGATGYTANESGSLLLGSHAFTAMASLVKPPAAAEKDADTPAEGAATVHGAAAGAASFRVTTADPSSPVLVGVSGHEIDLGTPLSWEEDHCFVVECSARGAFLWSDRGQTWGAKLSDKCFTQQQQGDGSRHAAQVDVSWTRDSVTFTMPATGESGSLPRPAVSDIQGRTIECASPPDLAPCTTFFCDLAEVTLL